VLATEVRYPVLPGAPDLFGRIKEDARALLSVGVKKEQLGSFFNVTDRPMRSR